MPDLGATDVTYSIQKERSAGNGLIRRRIAITFGDGALTYPAGGVPLTRADMGAPTEIEEFLFMESDADDGFMYKYDLSAETIRIYQSAIHTHDLHLGNADVVDGATTRVNAGTNLLGANTGADILVAGVAAVGAEGGILQVAAGAMTEVPNAFTAAATTLVAIVEGW